MSIASRVGLGRGRRTRAVAFAYCASCLAGAVAMLGYLLLWLGRGIPIHYVIVVPWLTGLIGGLAALPVALPFIAAAERWSWRNPLVYLVAALPLFVSIQLAGFAIGLTAGLFVAVPLNIEHALSQPAQMGYLSSLVAAMATYWAIRGRFSGMWT